MIHPMLSQKIKKLGQKKNTAGIQQLCNSIHPARIADALAKFSPQQIAEILSLIKARMRATIFSYLAQPLQTNVVEFLKRNTLIEIIANMPADRRVDFFNQLPAASQELLLPALAHAERENILKLAAYPPETAGAVMTSDYAVLLPDLTASEAIAKLRREAPDRETIYYTYVVDADRRLIGFVSLKDLILANSDRRVAEIMHRDVICSIVTDDQEEAALKIQKYDLIALPVVNEHNILVGIITYDDAIDIFAQEHTEDMEKLMAITGSHDHFSYMRTTVWTHFKNRSGWIFILALLGLVSGYIVQNFSALLLQISIIASFIPMLTDTGGNTGSQSSTLVVRALAVNEITPRETWIVLLKETKVAMLLGILLGIFSFVRVVLFGWNASIPGGHSLAAIGAAIATAMSLQVITATLIGALLPLAAAKLKLDPAVVASPALTTIVDITGLLIFFVTIKLFLGI
ncbi:MAG: magnesium transporter [Desulfobacterales bacterium]